MINGIELVTDRSLSDVEIAKSLIKKGLQGMTDEEKDYFLAGLKGAYNYTDINRVESAIRYLADRLVAIPDELRSLADELDVSWMDVFEMPYNQEDYEDILTKQDWSVEDIFESADRERYIENIHLIVQALNKNYIGLPSTLEKMTYKEANEIEKSLDDFYNELKREEDYRRNLISSIGIQWVYYSGEIYGGEA